MDGRFHWRSYSLSSVPTRSRVVAVAASEDRSFGATLSGRVWENDFSRGRCSDYVLASWFPPYVDLVGWLSRSELESFRERNAYAIQEVSVHPMHTLGETR